MWMWSIFLRISNLEARLRCLPVSLFQGVVLSKLVEDFFSMKEEILSRDFDLGFSGNSEDVVMRALHLLGNCVNVTSSANRNGEFTIAPSQTVPALFELNFYSNGLFHVFISDAIIGKLGLMGGAPIIWCLLFWRYGTYASAYNILNRLFPACSILSLQRELIAESESDHLPADVNGLPLSQERLIRKAAGLSYFLINEVTVAPVCLTKTFSVYSCLLSRIFPIIRFPDPFSPLKCLSAIFKASFGHSWGLNFKPVNEVSKRICWMKLEPFSDFMLQFFCSCFTLVPPTAELSI